MRPNATACDSTNARNTPILHPAAGRVKTMAIAASPLPASPLPPLLSPATGTSTSWSFVACWFALLLVHCLCVAYYVGFATAYRRLPMTNLAFQFRTYSIGIAESEYADVAIVHEVVAAVHGAYLLLMLGGSLQQRRLVFYPSWRRLVRFVVVNKMSPSTTNLASMSRASRRRSKQDAIDAASRAPLPRRLTRAWFVYYAVAAWRAVGRVVFGPRGLMGIDFVYFDHLLLARELLETGLQTYQAYRMTRLLPRLWLIRGYVALLVANCWIVPILHRVYLHRHRRRRMMSLICDVVLDLVSSMGISLFFVTTYWPQYTDPRFGFAFNNWYNDEWFVSVLQEFQMMLVISWNDMASRLVLAFGVLQCIECLKDLVHQDLRRQRSGAIRTIGITTSTTTVVPEPLHLVRAFSGPSVLDTLTGLPATAPAPTNRVVHLLLHVVGPASFVLWGVAILTVHIYAEAQRVDLPCQLPLRPWLSNQPACSLVEIDCHRLGASGSVVSLGNAWTVFDPALTAGLVVRHCPELTIPSSLALFTGLTSMKVYNATTLAWPASAGLTSQSHGRLRALYLVRTNFTNGTLPPGLLRSDFPQSFRSFIVSGTHLKELPPKLDTVWPKRMALSIEFAGFTMIPDVVMRLSPGMISFSQNPITSVPPSLFEIPTLGNLLLSYTAIQELPRHVATPGARLYVVMLEGTNLSTFWSWMDPIIAHSLSYRKRFFNAHGTPYCHERAQILEGTRTQFSATAGVDGGTPLATIMDVSTPSARAYATAAVACASDFKTLFPLAVQDAISAIP